MEKMTMKKSEKLFALGCTAARTDNRRMLFQHPATLPKQTPPPKPLRKLPRTKKFIM